YGAHQGQECSACSNRADAEFSSQQTHQGKTAEHPQAERGQHPSSCGWREVARTDEVEGNEHLSGEHHTIAKKLCSRGNREHLTPEQPHIDQCLRVFANG